MTKFPEELLHILGDVDQLVTALIVGIPAVVVDEVVAFDSFPSYDFTHTHTLWYKTLWIAVQNALDCGTKCPGLRYKMPWIAVFAYKQKTIRLQAKGFLPTSKKGFAYKQKPVNSKTSLDFIREICTIRCS